MCACVDECVWRGERARGESVAMTVQATLHLHERYNKKDH